MSRSTAVEGAARIDRQVRKAAEQIGRLRIGVVVVLWLAIGGGLVCRLAGLDALVAPYTGLIDQRPAHREMVGKVTEEESFGAAFDFLARCLAVAVLACPTALLAALAYRWYRARRLRAALLALPRGDAAAVLRALEVEHNAGDAGSIVTQLSREFRARTEVCPGPAATR